MSAALEVLDGATGIVEVARTATVPWKDGKEMYNIKWYDPNRGAPTPWGRADYRETIAEGIDFYGTPSHGGFRISAEREAELDRKLRCEGLSAEAARMGYSPGWYEEDCAALAVLYAFPGFFPPEAVALALDHLRYWCSWYADRAGAS
jgi:hypothetical protein